MIDSSKGRYSEVTVFDDFENSSPFSLSCRKARVNAEYRISRLRRLNLLNDVERVIDELSRAERETQEMLDDFRGYLAEFPRHGNAPSDESGNERKCLAEVLYCTREIIRYAEGRLQSARLDPELSDDLEEDVVSEFETYIRIEKELYDTVLQFRCALDENSAEFSPATGDFSSVDALINHLEEL